MYSYGHPHMAGQKQDDQHDHTFSSYVRIQDVALKTFQRRWTIWKSGERGSGISQLAARHDDDDDDYCIRLLCNYPLHLFLHIAPTCYSLANYLFSIQYNYSFWLCCIRNESVSLLMFPFLAMSRSSSDQSRKFEISIIIIIIII